MENNGDGPDEEPRLQTTKSKKDPFPPRSLSATDGNNSSKKYTVLDDPFLLNR